VCDYTTNLDNLIGLRETTDKWEEMVTEFTNKL
jgi:hypothetical protein